MKAKKNSSKKVNSNKSNLQEKSKTGKRGNVKKNINWGWFSIGIVFVVLVLVIIGLRIYNTNSYVAEFVRGGERVPVTADEFKYYLTVASMSAGMEDEKAEEGKNPEDSAREKALENLKEIKLQTLKAKERNLSLDTKDLKEIESSLEMGFIKDIGKDTLRDIFKDMKLADKLKTLVKQEIAVTPEEIKKTYEGDKNNFDNYTFRQIVYKITPDTTPTPAESEQVIDENNTATSNSAQSEEDKKKMEEKKADAKKKAEEALKKIKKGTDMKKLVKEESQDQTTKDKDGEVSYFGDLIYDTKLKEWAFKAKVGDVEIIESENEIKVVKLEKRSKMEEVKERVERKVKENKFKEMLDAWKNECTIETKPSLNSIKASNLNY